MRIVKNPDGSYINAGPLAGLNRFWDPEKHLPCGPTPWGQLVAVDVNTGKIAWRTTLGITESMPEGKQNTGRPGLGGSIVTASGLVFIGATDDSRFRAFDVKTGKEVWTVKLPASAESTPITYADARGKQYVAIVATGGGLIGAALKSDSVVVYALDDGAAAATHSSAQAQGAPVTTPVARPAQTSAVSSGTAAVAGASLTAAFPAGTGRAVTLRTCSNCHSLSVVSAQRHTAQDWNDLVQIMAGRGANATDAEFDQIAAYLARVFAK